MKLTYAICQKTGSVVCDTLGKTEVFYISAAPRLLKKHLCSGERVRQISPSRLKRTWVIKNGKKPLRVAHGVILATPTKAFAEQIIDMYSLQAVPSLYMS